MKYLQSLYVNTSWWSSVATGVLADSTLPIQGIQAQFLIPHAELKILYVAMKMEGPMCHS